MPAAERWRRHVDEVETKDRSLLRKFTEPRAFGLHLGSADTPFFISDNNRKRVLALSFAPRGNGPRALSKGMFATEAQFTGTSLRWMAGRTTTRGLSRTAPRSRTYIHARGKVTWSPPQKSTGFQHGYGGVVATSRRIFVPPHRYRLSLSLSSRNAFALFKIGPRYSRNDILIRSFTLYGTMAPDCKPHWTLLSGEPAIDHQSMASDPRPRVRSLAMIRTTPGLTHASSLARNKAASAISSGWPRAFHGCCWASLSSPP